MSKTDNRVRIHKSKHQDVREFYFCSGSKLETAKHFGVDPKTIYYIIHPEKYEERQKRRKDAKYHLRYKETVKRWRQKQKILNNSGDTDGSYRDFRCRYWWHANGL